MKFELLRKEMEFNQIETRIGEMKTDEVRCYVDDLDLMSISLEAEVPEADGTIPQVYCFLTTETRHFSYPVFLVRFDTFSYVCARRFGYFI